MKQCQRCLKQTYDEGVHTCTPTKLVRNLESELSATKEKLAKSESDASKWKSRCERRVEDIRLQAARLEAAEKRIRESQEQRAVGYVRVYGVDCLNGVLLNQTTGRIPLPSSTTIDPYPVAADDTPLYTMPPIPPELAELQRENAELRKQLVAGIEQNKQLWSIVDQLKGE